MIEAGIWGLVAASALVIGGYAALRASVPARVSALGLGFGAGLLISAFGFVLDEKAYELGGAGAAVLGFLGGALAFFVLERSVVRAAVPRAVLNGVPQAVAIAITLVEDGDIGGAIVAAVFLSNLAAGFAGGLDLRRWAIAALSCGVAAALAYGLLQSAPDTVVAVTQAAAIGAVLSITVGTMLPAAAEHRSAALGLVTTLGFGAGFALSIA